MDSSDASQFQRAMTNNETIDEITIELVKPAGAGKVQHYRNVTLKNAKVASVHAMGGKSERGGNEVTEVAFTYQKIEFNPFRGNPVSEDDWTQ